MSISILINKKKYAVSENGVPDSVLEAMKQKAQENELSLEKLVQLSLLNHWVQNDKMRKSDPEVIGALLRLAYDLGYDHLKMANAKVRVITINEERRMLAGQIVGHLKTDN